MTCSTSVALECTVTGLTNGDVYAFTVTATNVTGTGPTSTVVQATPATVPDAPVNVTATPGDTTALVTWQAPASDGGSPITSYEVSATDTSTDSVGVASCSGTSPSVGCTVSGLTDGDDYTFTVTATNVAGTGAASAASSAITPAAPPGPPTDVVASAGDHSASVTWTAPTSDGGSPVTGYVVTADDLDNAAASGATCDATDPAVGCTVTGLIDGDSYTFTVVASNAAGSGSASTPSLPVTPASVPGPPLGVTATAGVGSAAVSWSAPASNGGLPITGYTVTATDHTSSHGGESCTTTGALGCTVSNLTNGDSYTFTVTATSDAGTGAASTPSPAVTPATVPDAPTGVGAIAGDRSVSVTWSPPGFDGGSAVTGYTATATDQTNPGNPQETCQGTDPSDQCTVSGLTNGDSYVVTVTATNAVGTGSAASSAPVVPAAVPGRPSGVTAAPGDASALVSWTAPSSNGSTITGYTVTAADQTNSSNGSQTCQGSDPSDSCTVSGLTNGDSYTFTVTATNGAGSSAPSDPSAAVVPYTTPDAPSDVVASPGDTTASVTWSPPDFDGGSTIMGYTVTATDQTNALNGAKTCQGSDPSDTCTVTGLTDGDSYTFTVTASNAAGGGPSSAPSAPVTPFTTPDPPTLVIATPGDTTADVVWTPPLFDGGSTITDYAVTATDTTTPSNGGETCNGSDPTDECTVTGLTDGDTYTFTVVATNAAGSSAPSAPSVGVTPQLGLLVVHRPLIDSVFAFNEQDLGGATSRVSR